MTPPTLTEAVTDYIATILTITDPDNLPALSVLAANPATPAWSSDGIAAVHTITPVDIADATLRANLGRPTTTSHAHRVLTHPTVRDAARRQIHQHCHDRAQPLAIGLCHIDLVDLDAAILGDRHDPTLHVYAVDYQARTYHLRRTPTSPTVLRHGGKPEPLHHALADLIAGLAAPRQTPPPAPEPTEN